MHPIVEKILRRRNVPLPDFIAAVTEAVRMLGDQPRISARMQIAAALSAHPGGRICDIGGSTSAYLVVAHVLGTAVTVIDTLPYLHDSTKGFQAEFRRRLNLFDKLGIEIQRSDIFETPLPAAAYDVAVAFETIEHFNHSPKPVLTAMVRALVSGGRLCLSTPNIARINMRLRLLFGKTVHESFNSFFHDGNPFIGHHREYTLSEFRLLPNMLGLESVDVFAVNAAYESRKPKNAAQQLLIDLEEQYGIGDRLLPSTWRKHVWLDARKVDDAC